MGVWISLTEGVGDGVQMWYSSSSLELVRSMVCVMGTMTGEGGGGMMRGAGDGSCNSLGSSVGSLTSSMVAVGGIGSWIRTERVWGPGSAGQVFSRLCGRGL
jgi:hypothetical protein